MRPADWVLVMVMMMAKNTLRISLLNLVYHERCSTTTVPHYSLCGSFSLKVLKFHRHNFDTFLDWFFLKTLGTKFCSEKETLFMQWHSEKETTKKLTRRYPSPLTSSMQIVRMYQMTDRHIFAYTYMHKNKARQKTRTLLSSRYTIIFAKRGGIFLLYFGHDFPFYQAIPFSG